MMLTNTLLVVFAGVCLTTLTLAEDCYDKSDKGESYAGKVAVTASGRKCQAWASTSPHKHGMGKDKNFPLDGSAKGASNYCRNPDGEAKPWCYTTDPGKRYELCNVKQCAPQDVKSIVASSLKTLQETLTGILGDQVDKLKDLVEDMTDAVHDGRTAEDYNFEKLHNAFEKLSEKTNYDSESSEDSQDSSSEESSSESDSSSEDEDSYENSESSDSDEPKTCPEGDIPYEDSCLKIGRVYLTWQKAYDKCREDGYHLLYDNTKEKHDFVITELKKVSGMPSTGAWIGATDKDSEGHFKWMPANRPVQESSYSAWYSSQPSDSGGNEDCVHMYKSWGYAWNDYPCTSAMFYVCEIDLKDLGKELGSESIEDESEGCRKEAYLSHLPDTALTASSQYNSYSTPTTSRLYSVAMGGYYGGWMSTSSDKTPWIQADLGSRKQVVAIATQGREDYNSWVTAFVIQYSDNGQNWDTQTNGGHPFSGNNNRNGVNYHKLAHPFTARYVRILAKTWTSSYASIRWQLYGPKCEVCTGKHYIASLNGEGLKASSQLSYQYSARNAVLYKAGQNSLTYGAWIPKKQNHKQYIQMDLGKKQTIASIATQGREDVLQYVKSYRIKYSDNEHVWKLYENNLIITANFDSNSVVTHNLAKPFKARYVRLVPVEWYSYIALRWELYGPTGCEVITCNKTGVPTESFIAGAQNTQLSASSSYNDLSYGPRHSRINTYFSGDNGGWYPKTHNREQWIMVDLKEAKTVTAVATQGREPGSYWVKSYFLEFSNDDKTWESYVERGVLRVFHGNTNYYGVLKHLLINPFKARFVRLRPLSWQSYITLRWELYGTACEECGQPALLSDALITSSGCKNHAQCTSNSRILSSGNDKAVSWTPKTNNKEQWIQADLGKTTKVMAVSTMGRSPSNEYIKTFRLQYSDSGNSWTDYKEENVVRIFQANIDARKVVKTVLAHPIEARHIRLIPLSWYSHISVRWELFGASGCEQDVCYGSHLERTAYLSGAKLSASNVYSSYKPSTYGRLGQPYAWMSTARYTRTYMEADLQSVQKISGVVTQGMQNTNYWITGYYLYHSKDGKNWEMYHEDGAVRWFKGNVDRNSRQVNDFSKPILARFVRIHPKYWQSYIAVRWEILGVGCDECSRQRYVKNLPSSAITVSSDLYGKGPESCRLYSTDNGVTKGAWVAKNRRAGEWIQVDLGKNTSVHGVVTQGRDATSYYMTSYKIEYSLDGKSWTTLYSTWKGNKDRDTLVTNLWDAHAITCRFVRLSTVGYSSYPAVRFDVLGPKKTCK